jgi:hypothetical protein
MIPRPDRGQTLGSAPLDDLLIILLRQFKRPLAAQGAALADAEAETLARAVIASAPPTPLLTTVRAGLVAVIAESEAMLARWGLTFEQALDTPMDAIPGWETTAEFLEIANEKANAELRIAAGAALLTALGDPRHARKLLFLMARDPADPDAQMARRMLLFAARIDAQAGDWLAQAQAWVDNLPDSGVS